MNDISYGIGPNGGRWAVLMIPRDGGRSWFLRFRSLSEARRHARRCLSSRAVVCRWRRKRKVYA